jgi:hypothetical protein
MASLPMQKDPAFLVRARRGPEAVVVDDTSCLCYISVFLDILDRNPRPS